MKKTRTGKLWLLKRGMALGLTLALLETQGFALEVKASSAGNVETISGGVEITWENTDKSRGYVSKIPSSLSGEFQVPEGVYKIEDEAFEGGSNSRVTKIYLPSTFETKEYDNANETLRDVFDKFTALTDIDVSGSNKNFAALNGVLYSADRRTIMEYPVARTTISLGEASNAGDNPAPTRVGKGAFSGLKLTEFSLPSSVTDYEEHAFTNLTGVDRIVLPSKPALLKSYTFEHTGFKEINIPANIDGKSLPANWLITDHDVTVTIPSTITSIDDKAIVLENGAKATIKSSKDSTAQSYVTKLNNSNITFEETSGSSSSANASTGSSRTSGTAAKLNNQVTNMDNKNKVAAQVNGGSSGTEYTLLIKDSAGNNLKKEINMDSKTSLIAYDISLVDGNGNAVTNFNNVEITLPVPSNMDRTKGTIDVVTLDANGKLEPLRTSIKTDGDAVLATFQTSHFSEFGIRYIQDTASTTTASTASTVASTGASTTGAGTGTTNNTPRSTSNTTNRSDMPSTGDTETYRIMLMTMGALFAAMVIVMGSTRGAKKAR